MDQTGTRVNREPRDQLVPKDPRDTRDKTESVESMVKWVFPGQTPPTARVLTDLLQLSLLLLRLIRRTTHRPTNTEDALSREEEEFRLTKHLFIANKIIGNILDFCF